MAEQSALGIVLKRYRAAAGLSQERLAERAGISSRGISDLERGLHRTPHADTLGRLARALALSSEQRAVLLAAAHPEVNTAPRVSTTPATTPAVMPSAMPPLHTSSAGTANSADRSRSRAPARPRVVA